MPDISIHHNPGRPSTTTASTGNQPFKSAFIRVNPRLIYVNARESSRSFANRTYTAILHKRLVRGARRAHLCDVVIALRLTSQIFRTPMRTTQHSDPQLHPAPQPHHETRTSCSTATAAP